MRKITLIITIILIALLSILGIGSCIANKDTQTKNATITISYAGSNGDNQTAKDMITSMWIGSSGTTIDSIVGDQKTRLDYYTTAPSTGIASTEAIVTHTVPIGSSIEIHSRNYPIVFEEPKGDVGSEFLYIKGVEPNATNTFKVEKDIQIIFYIILE